MTNKYDKLYKSLEVLSFLVEKLNKSKKNDLQSLGSDPKAQEVVDFAHSKLRNTLPNGQLGGENWSNFYVSQYKKDPSIHNPQTQEKLTHFMGMKHMPEIANFKFDPVKHPTMEAGLNALSEAEKKGSEKAKSEEARWTPQKGKKVIDLGGGMGWWDLGVSYDPSEGKAMNHCGNVEGKSGEGVKDRLFSLRQEDPSRPGMAKPHVTVVNHKGYLGEIKGHSNNKPSGKFHEAIKSLLLSKHVKGVVGSGYAPENNFQAGDLTPEQYNEVITKKPRIFSPDKSELPKKFSERGNLNPEVTDLEAAANVFDDKDAKNILQEQHNKKFNTPVKIATEIGKDSSKTLAPLYKKLLKNPALTPELVARILTLSGGAGFLGDNKDDFVNHKMMQSPETAKQVYDRLPIETIHTMFGYAPNIPQEHFDKVFFDYGKHKNISRKWPNHEMLGPKHFNHLVEKNEYGPWLENKNVTPEIFNRAYAKNPNDVSYWGAKNPLFDKQKIMQAMPFMKEWGHEGRQGFVDSVENNPHLDNEAIDKINQVDPVNGTWLATHPAYGQKQVNDLVNQGLLRQAIWATSKRPDLKMPKDSFDQYIDALSNPNVHDQSHLFEERQFIFNHPHFGPEHIDKLSYLHPKELGNHPKATDEQKYRINQKPVDDFLNDFHNLTPHDKETQYGRLAPRISEEQKTALLNHPDTSDSFKTKFGGDRLSDWNKARLLAGGDHPEEVTITPEVVDKAVQSTDDKKGLAWYISDAHKANPGSVTMTKNQVEDFINSGVSPELMNPWLTDEQRLKYSKGIDNKADLYKFWIKDRHDWKKLPLSMFKKYYKDVDENSDYETKDLAWQALKDEGMARKHQLIHNILGEHAKLEDLHRYKNSHDMEVAKAARAELKRRGQLQKSNSLFLLMKKVSKK